ncbi:UPF0547 protein C16orf87 homolog isoform X2 [Peromyscus californicus insignis]|uniref:UPF0547 protein C16orf87 homolog isoform X2 n=1 Tax=Peromyscus californicus insignis TaxID=564181 RepID=UPI0022A771A2|nr:UPF0547 protein C16orf87 homolog isoform X2 [Peromyscus californicus insignis]
MSATRAKKVKMATKSCPECDQQIPVACKSCPCGYIFISRKLLNAKHSEKSPSSTDCSWYKEKQLIQKWWPTSGIQHFGAQPTRKIPANPQLSSCSGFPGLSGVQREGTGLTALIRAFTLARDKQINIDADSKYAYSSIHSNTLVWRPGILNPVPMPLVQKLPEAVLLPTIPVAMVLCRGYQK